MNITDVSELIRLAEFALQRLADFNQSGKLDGAQHAIRTLTTPLIEGTDISSDLQKITRVEDRYKLSMAVLGLHNQNAFSTGQVCLDLQGKVIFIRDALENWKVSLVAAKVAVERRIFYSWQSTLPNSDNRGFILDCLEKAVRALNANLEQSDRERDPGYQIDRDTQGVPGSADILDSILKKIDGSGVFVADVTLLADRQSNSNVMVELGYAIAKLGKSRILMVFNEAYGDIRDAPFDLGFKKMITYKYKKDPSMAGVEDPLRIDEKKNLTRNIQNNIKGIIEE